jgi:hypothetical protein
MAVSCSELIHRARPALFLQGEGRFPKSHYAQRWAYVKTILSYALALFGYAMALFGHSVRQPTL